MNEKEALIRVKTGNFNGGYGFDMQLLVDTVGIIGEMFRNGQISEVVRCKDCKHHGEGTCSAAAGIVCPPPDDWFCADGERKE